MQGSGHGTYQDADTERHSRGLTRDMRTLGTQTLGYRKVSARFEARFQWWLQRSLCAGSSLWLILVVLLVGLCTPPVG